MGICLSEIGYEPYHPALLKLSHVAAYSWSIMSALCPTI
jgi:hypothetical protein